MFPSDTWNAVDQYVSNLLVPPDEVLTAALQASDAAGLPAISVAPNQGKFLMILAQLQGARRILEIGTLGGYSAIWFARALPAGGQLVTLEASAKHAAVARSNIARAGLSDRVDLRVGPALETLPILVRENTAPFDMVFIDADKPNTAAYFEWALKLTRAGGSIVIDNVARKGELINAQSDDPNVQGMRRMIERVAAEPGVTATAIQTVGSKGYDGFLIALVNA
jgi:predicted O-methyltransferase YrrM